MAELLNQSQLARRLSLTKGRLSQLVKEGRLNSAKATDPITKRVLFDYSLALKALSKKDSNIEEEEKEIDVDATYDQARTKKMLFTAELERLEYEKTKELLISKDKIEKEAFECARRVREALSNIPDRFSSELASIQSEFEIHKLLSQEINQILMELSE